MCRGWGAGQDPVLLQPYPEHGSATVRGRALDLLRVISPASVSPGVRGYGNTLHNCRSAAEPSLSSCLVRASVQRADIDPFQPSSIPAACSLLCYKEGMASSSGRLRGEAVPE